MKTKAIIFDLDGVLVSTDILHKESLVQAIREIINTNRDIHLSEKSMMSTKSKLRIIQGQYNFSNKDFYQILARKDEIFFDKLRTLDVPGNVIATLHYIKGLGIKTAIASNSRIINIEKILEVTQLADYFDAIVSAEEVTHRKPAPDVIYMAYKKLNIQPADYMNTIFVEDSDEGVQAGDQTPSVVVRINNPQDLTVDFIQEWIA